MDKRLGSVVISLWVLAFLLTSPQDAFSQSTPKSIQEMVKKLKLDPSILASTDEELRVPTEWIENARREAKVRLFSTFRPARAKVFLAPFKERYPFIAVEYSTASRKERAIKTLVAYKSGNIVTDVLTQVGGSFYAFKKADAVEDLSTLPAMKNIPERSKDPDGLWVGFYSAYWCMGYNTNLVKKEELPKKWEDLLTNPRWRGGNLALGNRPNLWALQLWQARGEKWTKDFLSELFREVRPQLRKEGSGALLGLLALGEYHAAIPGLNYRIYQKGLDGAPIDITCPEPIPVDVQNALILKRAPNIHAAKVFLNWLLSVEGQIALSFATYVTPVHKNLQRPELVALGDRFLGKKEAFAEPAAYVDVLPKLVRFWNDLWLRGGGKPRKRK